MTLDDACEVLEALGSLDDPVWFHQMETTVRDIARQSSERDPRRTRIAYYGSRGKELRRTNGTVYSMCVDRLKTA